MFISFQESKLNLPWKSDTTYHTNLKVLKFNFCDYKASNFLLYFSTIKFVFISCAVCISQLSSLYFSNVQFVFLNCPLGISQPAGGLHQPGCSRDCFGTSQRDPRGAVARHHASIPLATMSTRVVIVNTTTTIVNTTRATSIIRGGL